MNPGPGRLLVVFAEVDPEVLSGGTVSLLRCLGELEARGWELTIWTAKPSATERALRARGHAVFGAPRELRFSLRQLRVAPGPRRRLLASLAYLREFERFLRQHRFDVMIGNTAGTLPELWRARRRGVPTVLHVLEILPPGAKYALARRLLLHASDTVIAPSRATAEQFGEGRVSVVHTGIEAPKRVARTEPPSPGPVVGMIGTICRRKGTDLYVAAAERWRREGLEVRLCGRLIEGAERPEAARILDRALALGVKYARRADPWEELPGWDLLVVPSRQDPFPNVVLEAMAIGTPVVGSRVGGIPEQLGETGVLVDPEDPAALAAAVLELAGDPERRAALALAAQRRARERFSVRAQADGTEAALFGAIERRRAGAPAPGSSR